MQSVYLWDCGGGGSGGGDGGGGGGGGGPGPTRKKEGEEINIGNLPKHASDFQAWMDNVVDAVTACARNANTAFAWVARVEQDDCTFDEVGIVPDEFLGLDAKIRVGMTKHTTGPEAEKNKELVSTLLKRRDELKKAAPPRQVTGLQLLWLVKSFYQIHVNERVQFDLVAFMELEYPGDAEMGWFKRRVGLHGPTLSHRP